MSEQGWSAKNKKYRGGMVLSSGSKETDMNHDVRTLFLRIFVKRRIELHTTLEICDGSAWNRDIEN
jgi:hypothetical protein